MRIVKIIAFVLAALLLVGVAFAARGPHYGDSVTAGQVQLSDGSGNWLTLLTGSLSSNADCYLPTIASALADTGVVHTTAAGVMAVDTTNFVWDNTANAQLLKLGAGTGGGTLQLLEGSGGGTNTVAVTAPATLAGNIEYTLPNALPTTANNFMTVSTTGAITQVPAQRILYAATAASAAHTGDVTAETVVMPASAEDPLTVATDIGDANLEAGNVFTYTVCASSTTDTPGDETLTINVYFGSQLVGTSGAVAIDAATELLLEGTVTIFVTGASGTGYYTCKGIDTQGGTTTLTHDAAAFSSFDTTGTNAFSVKLDWGGTTAVADTSAVENVILTLNAAN